MFHSFGFHSKQISVWNQTTIHQLVPGNKIHYWCFISSIWYLLALKLFLIIPFSNCCFEFYAIEWKFDWNHRQCTLIMRNISNICLYYQLERPKWSNICRIEWKKNWIASEKRELTAWICRMTIIIQKNKNKSQHSGIVVWKNDPLMG